MLIGRIGRAYLATNSQRYVEVSLHKISRRLGALDNVAHRVSDGPIACAPFGQFYIGNRENLESDLERRAGFDGQRRAIFALLLYQQRLVTPVLQNQGLILRTKQFELMDLRDCRLARDQEGGYDQCCDCRSDDHLISSR